MEPWFPALKAMVGKRYVGDVDKVLQEAVVTSSKARTHVGLGLGFEAGGSVIWGFIH